MIFTCVNTNCRAKFMEEESYEKDGELLCPECNTPVAKIKEVDLELEEHGLKSGIDIQPEYVVGARKLKAQPKDSYKKNFDDISDISIKETSNIMKELEDTKDSLKECIGLDNDEINKVVAEYKEELVNTSSSLGLSDIQKLVDEKEANLRFNLTKAINAILRGQQWLLNRGGDEIEYSTLSMFDKFN